MLTEPPIEVAQNTPRAKQLIAAQARLYSDAKTIHHLRLALVFVFAAAGAIAGLAMPGVRPHIGAVAGIALLLVALVVTGVEKRRRVQAAAIQEEFDTAVFQLSWNGVSVERPSATAVARAAARYAGGREADWYPSTGWVVRPLDILICQASNLGWGASMHRLWAALLGFALALMAALVGLATWLLHLSFAECILALLVPALAPAKELIDLIKTNLENAASKETMERNITDLWKKGLAGEFVAVDSIRAVQNCILDFRKSNAYVPDWLDRRFRQKNEAAMRSGAAALVEEATAHGRVARLT
ncbi:S-4TM family putative pore-forming effector [Micromonospora echinospora]|uniref:S-4TM family putative pore-forming effector n=1 Tax=Micromonospora echinospora TaxID=1877 RepID=UPI00367112B5